MATTTPNFSWPVPTSTDLVKDGATAIESLGDAIDASLLDLKGGTTGQVLSKASGTDMDFTWVAQDDSNAIQNAIVDAKGDLIGATAADTPARLAVGTNGQVLTADSTASTGLAWASPSSGGMTLLSTTTLSGSSTSISVSPSGYNELKIYVTGVNGAADFSVIMGINSDGTAANFRNSWSADIGYDFNEGRDASLTGSLVYLVPGVNGADSGNTNNSAMITIGNPNSTVSKNIFSVAAFYNDSQYYSSEMTQCNYVTTSAISSLQFKTTSSSFSAGEVKIYGVK